MFVSVAAAGVDPDVAGATFVVLLGLKIGWPRTSPTASGARVVGGSPQPARRNGRKNSSRLISLKLDGPLRAKPAPNPHRRRTRPRCRRRLAVRPPKDVCRLAGRG